MHSRRFLQLLLDSGHSVFYVDQNNSKLQRKGMCTFIPYPTEYGWFQKFRYKKILTRWWMAFQFWVITLQYKPDLIHIHLIGNSAYYCLSANLHPMILTSWGSDINDFFPIDKQDLFRLEKISYILNSADYITADSQEVLDRCEILAKNKLKTSLYYYGIDINLFKPLPIEVTQEFRRTLGIKQETKILLSIRRLIPKMCHDLILKAFYVLLQKTKKEVVLIFREALDRDEEYSLKLKSMGDELGISDKLIWLRETTYDQMPIIYNIADAVVNFPNQDGLPVSLFEAAACMKPTVTSELMAYEEFLLCAT